MCASFRVRSREGTRLRLTPGALGSTRTHAKRVARLKEQGFSDADIARIHAPVGLDIGSKSPSEIAISVMAQITQVLRQGE